MQLTTFDKEPHDVKNDKNSNPALRWALHRCLSSAGKTFLFSTPSDHYLSFGVKDKTLCFESNENIPTD